MKEIARGVGLGLLLAGLIVAPGCDDDDGTGPGTGHDARGLQGSYSWVLQGWEAQAPVGYPVVLLTWELPKSYRNEPFRIYARRTGGGYGLIATVTSCSAGLCQYTDPNISAGSSYEYYVVTFDERHDQEIGASAAVRVDVPQFPELPVPASLMISALDNAVFLHWGATGAHRYFVLAQEEGGTRFLIGQTDGTSFYDDRARNGVRYTYQVAGADAFGQVSRLSAGAEAIPRPDFHGEVVFAHADRPAASGFHFVENEQDNPVLSGGAPGAQWRLEVVGGNYQIQPLGATTITRGVPTTALTCGPGSSANCQDVRVAPSPSAFGTAAVPVEIGTTYVLRVVASDGRPHYGKLRVLGASVDSNADRLILFDWAYQLRADEPRLNRSGD